MDAVDGQHPAEHAVNNLAVQQQEREVENRTASAAQYAETRRFAVVGICLAGLSVVVSIVALVVGSGGGPSPSPIGWLVPILAACVGAFAATSLAAHRKLASEHEASVVSVYIALARLQTLAEQYNLAGAKPPLEVYKARYREFLTKVHAMLVHVLQLKRDPSFADRIRLAAQLLEAPPLPHGDHEKARELRERFVRIHADTLEPFELALLSERREDRTLSLPGEDLVPRPLRERDRAWRRHRDHLVAARRFERGR